MHGFQEENGETIGGARSALQAIWGKIVRLERFDACA